MDYETEQVVAWVTRWLKGCFERAKVSAIELQRREVDPVFVTITRLDAENFENRDCEEVATTIFAEAKKDAGSAFGNSHFRVLAFGEGASAELPFARADFCLLGEMEALAVRASTRSFLGFVGEVAQAVGDALQTIGTSVKRYSGTA